MNRLILFIFVFSLSACNQYALVKPEPIDISGMTIIPSMQWNSAASLAKVGGKPTWTSDGPLLNSIVFFPAIEDGDTLFKSNKKEQYPTYSSDMLPNEIVEVVESSIVKIYDATINDTGNLRPLLIDNNPGFQYDFSFNTADNITRKAYIAGTTKSEKLYLMFYQATAIHYFEQYIDEVKTMAENMKLE